MREIQNASWSRDLLSRKTLRCYTNWYWRSDHELNVPRIDAEEAKIELIRNQEEEEKRAVQGDQKGPQWEAGKYALNMCKIWQESAFIGAYNNLIDNPIDATDGCDLNRLDDK